MVASRILTVCQVLHSLNVGGAEMLAARLVRRLNGRFRFVFACLDEIGPLGDELRQDGFTVHLLGRKAGVDWTCGRRMARLLQSEQVDVVHAHQYTPFFYAMTARFPAWGRPILFTEHGRHVPDFPRLKRKLANRILLSRADRLVGVGAAVRTALINNDGFPARRVDVLYNGIDVAAFSTGADREAARRSLGVDGDELAIVQVARLDYLKDHATALRMLARIAERLPHARLVLVGDGVERQAIEVLARELGVSDRLRLLGTRSDVSRLLHGADIFLLTSISEGIPLTVIEAMAAGLPVVGTDVGGMVEVVADGVTGLLAPVRDDAILAAHVIRLASDPDLRRQFGTAGRERARASFDEQRMCDEYGRHYRELARV